MTIDLKDVQLEIQDRAIYLHQNGITILRATIDHEAKNIRAFESDNWDLPFVDIAHAVYTDVRVPKQVKQIYE